MNAPYSFCTIIALLCFMTTSICGQRSQFNGSSKKFKDKYADQLGEDEKIKNSWYQYVTTENGNKEHFVRTFYPETKQIVSYEQYETKKYLNKTGPAKYWFENGLLKSEGAYTNNQPTGQWKFYSYEDGSITSVGMYKSGAKIGQWTYYEDKKKKSLYSYKNDLKEGPFLVYDSLGRIENQGTYKNNLLYSQLDKNIESDSLDIEILPQFKSEKCEDIEAYEERSKCAEDVMLHFIYKNLKFPKNAREYGVQGRVITQFVVNEEGDIEDLVFLRALSDEIKEACEKVIMSMPKWVPGSRNGEFAKVKFTLPIQFRLN